MRMRIRARPNRNHSHQKKTYPTDKLLPELPKVYHHKDLTIIRTTDTNVNVNHGGVFKGRYNW